MKKIGKYIFVSLLTLAFCGCENSETDDNLSVDTGDFASTTWTLSSATRESDSETLSNTLNITYGGYLTFTDTTEGAVSHEWLVQDQYDNVHLLSGTPDSDASSESLALMVVSGWDYTSDAESISLYFPEPGYYDVTLRNTFDKEAMFDFDGTYWRDVDVYANDADGVYIWEETFHVAVYTSLMEPSVKVFRDAELTDEITLGTIGSSSTYPTESILVGETLYFVDATTGDPDSWYWYCKDLSKSVETQTAAILFNPALESSDPKTTMTVTLSVSREADVNNDTPAGYIETIEVPLTIEVNLDNAPLVANAPILLNSREIEFDLNNDTNNAVFTSEYDLDEDEFTITYENDYSATAYYKTDYTTTAPSATLLSGDIRVKSAVVTDDGKLRLTTRDDMYNTDRLQIKYVGTAGFLVDNNSNRFDSTVAIPESTPTFVQIGYYDFETADQLDDWEVTTNSAPTVANELDSDAFGIVPDPFGGSGYCLMLDTEEAALSSPILRYKYPITLDVDNNKYYANKFYLANDTYSAVVMSTVLLCSPYSTSDTVNLYNDSVWDSSIGANASAYSTALKYITYGDAETAWASWPQSVGFNPVNEGDTPASTYNDLMFLMKFGTYAGKIYIDNFYLTDAEAR